MTGMRVTAWGGLIGAVLAAALLTGAAPAARSSTCVGENDLHLVDPPKLSGNPEVGGTLKTTSGKWSACPGATISYSYSWYSGGVMVPGASSNQYLVSPSDAGYSIYALVLARSSAGGIQEARSNVLAIPGQPLQITVSGPLTTGSIQQGSYPIYVTSAGHPIASISVYYDGQLHRTLTLPVGSTSFDGDVGPYDATPAGGISPGPHTVTVTARDPIGHTASQTLSFTILAPPTTVLGGDLYGDRTVVDAEGDEDSGYVDTDTTLAADVTSHKNGIASVEMWVNGQRLRSADLYTASCDPGCPMSVSTTFTLHPSDLSSVAPGSVRVDIIARDRDAPAGGAEPGPDITVSSFDVYIADPTDTGPDDPDSDVDAPDPPDSTASPTAAKQAASDGVQAMPDSLVRSLTADERRRATEVFDALANAPGGTLQRILQGAPYRVEAIGPSTVIDDLHADRPAVVGATLLVVLEATRTYRGTVPTYTIKPPDGRGHGARRVPYRAAVTVPVVKDLLVELSFADATLTSVRFGPSSRVERFDPVAGSPPLPTLPAHSD